MRFGTCMVCLSAFLVKPGAQRMQGQSEDTREIGTVVFHPMRAEEYNIPKTFGNQLPQQFGTRPKYWEFLCGECGSITQGRVVCDLVRKSDQALVMWCLCPCES